jgi:Fe-S-cluster containining protein
LTAESRTEKGTCIRCGGCCTTYPCALAPDDLGKIADFLGMSCADVFRRYLVLDYAAASGKKHFYVCPARVGDRTASFVDWDWAFASSPCIFLRDDSCAIQPVKPLGGRTFICDLATTTRADGIFGKRQAAKAWRGSSLLGELLTLAKTQASSGHVSLP